MGLKNLIQNQKSNNKYNIKRANIVANKTNITNLPNTRIIKNNKKFKRKKST